MILHPGGRGALPRSRLMVIRALGVGLLRPSWTVPLSFVTHETMRAAERKKKKNFKNEKEKEKLEKEEMKKKSEKLKRKKKN